MNCGYFLNIAEKGTGESGPFMSVGCIAIITMLNALTISLYMFFTTSLFIVGIYLTKTIRVKKVNNLLKVIWLFSATPNSDFNVPLISV